MSLTVHATTEYGTLHRVAMRYAGDLTPDVDSPDIHPVLARQKTTSRWAPYTPAKVREQQHALITVLRERGTDVVLLADASGCTTQHYPRDIGFVIDNVLFAARLNSTHRLPETTALNDPATAIPTPAMLSTGTIEGGDVMLHDRCVLVGLSEETSRDGITALQTALGEHHIDREVVPVQFATGGIVHLDDHFNIVAPGTALIHRSVFPAQQISWFASRFDLIDVTDEEALAVQVNVLPIAPGLIVATDGNDRITAELTARGIEVIHVDYSEVTRIPGSLRCTTLPLLRT